MADITTTTTNEEGFEASNSLAEYELTVHAQGKTAPSPNETLVADYASCFTFAFRAAAMRGDVGDLGRIETDAEADLDEDDHLAAIRFTMRVADQLSDEEVSGLLETAEELCHVHAALREGLHAEVDVETGAF